MKIPHFSVRFFPFFNAFKQSLSVVMQSLDRHNSNTKSTLSLIREQFANPEC